jgi:glycerophosphoryl diester phosphodiesterase
MRIVAHRGNRLHAPENTAIALLSAYTAGADALEFDVQLTKDGRLVVSHDGTIERLTGQPGKILEMTLSELRRLNFGATFSLRDGSKYPYRALIEPFPELLSLLLPCHIPLLIELKHDSSINTGRREEFVEKAVRVLVEQGAVDRTVLYSKDPENLRLARQLTPKLKIAAFDWELTPDAQIQLALEVGADGLVTELSSILNGGELTQFGNDLKRLHEDGVLPVGAILYPFRTPGVFTKAEFEALQKEAFVWSVSTDSMLDVANFVRSEWKWIDDAFGGTEVNRRRWSFGYAKANKYCHVFQDEGVHIKIAPYDGEPDPPPTNDLERAVQMLKEEMWYALRDWPFYSGGGVGLLPGISGDFRAEVDYTVQQVGQATTLEMAVVNADPGAHQANIPSSFRSKDSFYDPHGAPPFVGVEHDEDDGYRINWNLGSEYDNNQYGSPRGNGKALSGRLRLERRGAHFAAYYRNNTDASDWVCVGAVRNESLNNHVYLRCVGKRWRQEREDDPTQFYPILENEFVFRNLTISRFV